MLIPQFQISQAADCEGCRTALLFPEQHPPPLSKLTEGPQHESPVSANLAYLSFTFSFIFSKSAKQ